MDFYFHEIGLMLELDSGQHPIADGLYKKTSCLAVNQNDF